MTEDTSLPLHDVQVLDLSRVLAGPMAAMTLGDLGAEVIKVEHPRRGDDTRDWGHPVGKRNTTYYNSANRNKRAIGIDLHSEDGYKIIEQLVARCDIVIHNFKPGGAEKLGLDYAKLAAINPRLIYCSIRGYSSATAKGSLPGYDVVIQGEAGLMALSGEAGQGPLKFGIAIVDLATGMHSVQAILAALYQRERTGKGREIEMTLYDCGTALSAYCGLDALLLQRDPAKYGNAHASVVPYGVFEAKDGPLVIAVGNNSQYRNFCDKVLKRPELATDERFATNLARAKHRDTLLPELRRELLKHSRAELLPALRAHNVPCGEVNGLWESLTSEHSRESGLVSYYSADDFGKVAVLAPPHQFDGKRLPVRRPPPELGQDTDAVLRDLLGYSETAITELKSRGVC